MKIGIMTFHRAANYGAILQAYALRSVLCKTGNEVDIIDYRCKFIEDYYCFVKLFLPRNWKRFLGYLIHNGNLRPNKELFFSFLKNKNMVTTKQYYTDEQLDDLNLEYDMFVSGSDQVWNYITAGFDKNYFLDFVDDDKKKYSYAASFGISKLPIEYEDEYRKRLSGYQNYSVREEAGKKIIRNLLKKNATVDLDPTLLISREEWESLKDINNKKIPSIIKGQKYVLVYMIAEDLKLISVANEIAKKIDAKVLYINDRWKRRKGALNIKNVTVEEWLYLFCGADFVVTNSFHGVAFSINLNKQFLVVKDKSNTKVVSRIDNILNKLGLSKRQVDDIQKGVYCASENIDYCSVNHLLEEQRKESINHINELVKIKRNYCDDGKNQKVIKKNI